MSLKSRLTRLIALAAVAAIVLGYLGGLHPALDTFSHFRMHLAAMLAIAGVVLLALRGWRLGGAAALVVAAGCIASTLLAGVAVLLGPQAAATGAVAGARYRLLQINLLYDNPTPEKVLSLIGRAGPDVVTLDEVPERWQEKLKLIEAAYPYRIFCPPPAYIGGVAILSRRPFAQDRAPRCYDRGSLAIADIDFGGRIVSIAALHLGWPWPFDQPGQISAITPVLEAELTDTALLAGDFNAVPWSEAVQRVATAGDMRIVRGIGPTWLEQGAPNLLRRLAGFPIDNVLTKGRIVVAPPKRLSYVGSDHLPVLVEFGLTPPTPEAAPMEAKLEQ